MRVQTSVLCVSIRTSILVCAIYVKYVHVHNEQDKLTISVCAIIIQMAHNNQPDVPYQRFLRDTLNGGVSYRCLKVGLRDYISITLEVRRITQMIKIKGLLTAKIYQSIQMTEI